MIKLGITNLCINNVLILTICLFTFLIFFYLSDIADSKIIWQIGKPDDKLGEFISSSDRILGRIIDYKIPQDWKLRVTQNDTVWGDFPYDIYPGPNEINKPQEIWLNFDYPEKYPNPILKIKAKGASKYLEIYKGSEATRDHLVGRQLVKYSDFIFYDFPLGNIRKGLLEENRIIIRVTTNPENRISNVSPINLDMLCLDFTDTDSDGISDTDEGDGNLDQDGDLDKLDQDTVCIPLKSDNPKFIKRICLDINEIEGESISFHEVEFIDPNFLNFSSQLMDNHYLPYGIVGFKIDNVVPEQEDILINICYTDDLSSSVNIYTYNDTNVWHRIPFEFIDTNTLNITLKDGESGDMDGEKNGSINTFMAILYPRTLGMNIKEDGCFIKAIVKDTDILLR